MSRVVCLFLLSGFDPECKGSKVMKQSLTECSHQYCAHILVSEWGVYEPILIEYQSSNALLVKLDIMLCQSLVRVRDS